jgi:hypothetical protein
MAAQTTSMGHRCLSDMNGTFMLFPGGRRRGTGPALLFAESGTDI